MAQRLNAINVGYRPLNPADDVAGLAGQKQAVVEFEAKSADAARRAAADNARAANAIKAAQVSASAMNGMITAQNNLKKAEMQIGMQQAELAHKVLASNAQLDMQQRMMPLEMDRMAIENGYAIAKGDADISATKSHNAVRAQLLKQSVEEEQDVAALNGLEEAVAAHIANGGTVASYKSNHAALKTLKGQQYKEAIMDNFKLTGGTISRAATAQAQAVAGSTLNQGQLDYLDKRGDYTATGASGTFYPEGGAKLYKNSDESLNDDGQDLQRRMLKTNEMTDPERAMVTAPGTNAGGGNLFEMVDGNLVLTDAGIAEVTASRGALTRKMYLSGMTINAKGEASRDFEVTSVEYRKQMRANLDQRLRPDELTGKIPQITREMYNEARKETLIDMGIDVTPGSGTTPEQVRMGLEEGRALFRWNKDNTLTLVGSDRREADAKEQAVATKAATVEAVQDAKTNAILDEAFPAEGTTVMVDKVEGIKDPTKNTPFPEPVDGTARTSLSPAEWEKSIHQNKGDLYKVLTKPKGQKERGDFTGKSAGIGMPEEVAGDLIAHNQAFAARKGATTAKAFTANKAIETGIKQIADKDDGANTTRDNLAKGFLIEKALTIGYEARNKFREADEIVSSKLMDAKVTLGDWKEYTPVAHVRDFEKGGTKMSYKSGRPHPVPGMTLDPQVKRKWFSRGEKPITLREALELPAAENWTFKLAVPWQKETLSHFVGDLGLPPEFHRGHLPIKGRKQETMTITLDPSKHDIDSIFKNIELLSQQAEEMKRFHKYIR